MQLNIFVHIPKCAGSTIRRHIVWEYRPHERFRPHRNYKNDAIAKVLSDDERAEWAANPKALKRSWISKYLYSLSAAQRQAMRCILGHSTYYGIHEAFEQEPRYFTFLREPVARFISFYNYMLTHNVTPERHEQFEILKRDGTLRSLEEWLEQANIGRFSMTSFLAQIYRAENLWPVYAAPAVGDLEMAKAMLKEFYFVGLTENDDDFEFTYNRLGITRRLPDARVLKIRSTYVKPANYEEAEKMVVSKFPSDIELYKYAVQLNRQQKDRIPDYQEAVLRTRAKRNATRPYMQVVWSWHEWRRGLVDRVKRLF